MTEARRLKLILNAVVRMQERTHWSSLSRVAQAIDEVLDEETRDE